MGEGNLPPALEEWQMPSVVDICNYALSHMGKGTIASLSEASEAARSCSLRYESIRDKSLEDFPWRFAQRQTALSLRSGITIVGWDYVYAYPPNCISVNKVFTPATYNEPEREPFDEFNPDGSRSIVTNLASAYAEFTARITDPSLFTSLFVEALSFHLASDLAVKLTGSDGTRNDLLKIYFQKLMEAKTALAGQRYEDAKLAKSYARGRWA